MTENIEELDALATFAQEVESYKASLDDHENPPDSADLAARRAQIEAGIESLEELILYNYPFREKIAKEKGTKTFSKITTAQMFDKNGNVLMSTDGECQVTNVTDEWIEGNFHFTFKDDASGTTHQVTDGLFRVAMPKKWKNS